MQTSLLTFIIVEFVVLFLFTCLPLFMLVFFGIFLFTCLPFYNLMVIVILGCVIICKQVRYLCFCGFVCNFNVKRCKGKTPVSRIFHFRNNMFRHKLFHKNTSDFYIVDLYFFYKYSHSALFHCIFSGIWHRH